MKVFIGSSTESKSDMREVAAWIEEAGHEPLTWDDPSVFIAGDYTFLRIQELSKEVDAAVFIFSEDDKIWYRRDMLPAPRDNVLIEYGLFAGALNHKRAIFCLKGKPKSASDVQGITYVDLNLRQRARIAILSWIQRLEPQKIDPAISELKTQQALLREELNEIKRRLDFEQQKSKDLQILITKGEAVNFNKYDFSTDAHWKLLFDYEYIHSVVDLFSSHFNSPRTWQNELKSCEAFYVIQMIQWKFAKNLDRTRLYIGKSLRVFRQIRSSHYLSFLKRIDESLLKQIDAIGKQRVSQLP